MCVYIYIYIYIHIGPPPVHQLGIMPGSAPVGSAQYRRKRQQQEKVRKALREEPGLLSIPLSGTPPAIFATKPLADRRRECCSRRL